MAIEFRPLRADEIECRVGQVSRSGKGLSLLLYKTARCDQNILDETVGPENWQCRFYEQKGTLFCSMGIRVEREDGTHEWVWKDNAGSPSNMEAAKGEASDCMKRSGFCWGIGRELYTAPFIWVGSEKCNMRQGAAGKLKCYDDFRCEKIRIEDGEITGISIFNGTTNHRCFVWTKEG